MADMIAVNDEGMDCFARRADTEQGWHGKGQIFAPQSAPDVMEAAAGMGGATLMRSKVRFAVNADGLLQEWGDQHVLAWKTPDGKAHPVGVVSSKFQTHYKTLRDAIAETLAIIRKLGGDVTTVMMLKDRAMMVICADFKDYTHAVGGSDEDRVTLYVTMGTAFDGSLKTTWHVGGVRVVCWNTWCAAIAEAQTTVRQSHRSRYSAVKTELGLDVESFARAMRAADELARVKLSPDQTTDYLSAVYFDKSEAEMRAAEETAKQIDRMLRRVQPQLMSAPGAQTRAARGTLWGAFNAVTHDVDHVGTARNADTRAFSASFGTGADLKQRAWDRALALAA